MPHWKDKQVLIVGAARQGTALARYLSIHGAEVILNDLRKASELRSAREELDKYPIGWVLGDHPTSLLYGTDLICPSGGVPLDIPLISEAQRKGLPLSNDSQIFLENAPCRVVGITGSAGKTTTTTLAGRMAQSALDQGLKTEYRHVFIGGNIGNPLIEKVDEMTQEDLAIMELSSFQLDLMDISPDIAAILNLTPNHLDRHGSMQAYREAKQRILKFQNEGDFAVLGRDDPGAWELRKSVQGKLGTFGLQPPQTAMGEREQVQPEFDLFIEGNDIVLRKGGVELVVMPTNAVSLRGEHNLRNVLAACAVAYAAGVPLEALRTGVEGFQGIEHRLEFVHTIAGADWYNDSIATAPERAIAGIEAFDAPLVLLAGGRDKNLPWLDFAVLVCERIDHLVTFGEAGPMIADLVVSQKAGRPETVDTLPDLHSAIQTAAQRATPGDTVLFSPGGASFDEFEDFSTRGEKFKKWVSQLS